jgi:uncharacterized protein
MPMFSPWGNSSMRCKPRRRDHALRCVFCLTALLLAHRAALAVIELPAPHSYVVDTAHVLDSVKRQRIENLLKELEQKTTDQIIVLTVPSTEGEDIFSFAQRQAMAWKLGQKDKKNGVLIVLAVKDHRIRIQTGYGLEGSLPDSWIGTLSREIAQQYFRKGQFAEGLYEMTLSVVNKVAADEGVKISGLPQAKIMPGREGFFPGCLMVLPILFFFWLFLVWMSRRHSLHRTYWGGNVASSVYWGSILNDILRSNSTDSWGSGGGFGGGGFGGGGGSFGGGGGGSFGGGGGGASW